MTVAKLVCVHVVSISNALSAMLLCARLIPRFIIATFNEGALGVPQKASPMLLANPSIFCLVRLASWSSWLWAILLLILRRMASLGGYLTSTGLAWDVIRTLLLSLLGLLTTLALIVFL